MLVPSRSLSAILESSPEDLSKQSETISAQMNEAKEKAATAHQKYEQIANQCNAIRIALTQCDQELASLKSEASELPQDVGLGWL